MPPGGPRHPAALVTRAAPPRPCPNGGENPASETRNFGARARGSGRNRGRGARAGSPASWHAPCLQLHVVRKAIRGPDAFAAGKLRRGAEPLVLVLEADPERRRTLACYVRGAAVDVFELGKLEALRWYLERSSRRPDLLVIGVPVADDAGLRQVATANPDLPILLVARSPVGRAAAGPGNHPTVVVDGARQGEELARRVLGMVRIAAATRLPRESA